MTAKLYGIGVGPGDPELITLKAKRVLETADIIFIPKAKEESHSIAFEIIKEIVPPDKKVTELILPMTNDKELLEASWLNGSRKIVEQLGESKTGAFITIGDCMLYSTYSYLLGFIRKNSPKLEIESIPGITAFAASASAALMPLAEGSEKLVVIPALRDVNELPQILEQFSNIVLMKVASCYDQVLDILQKYNLQKSALLISKCGHEDQLIEADLESLRGKKIHYLSLMIIKQGGKFN